MRLIVDIDIIIDYLRGGVIWENILESINKDCEVYIATVVILELFSGRISEIIVLTGFRRVGKTCVMQYIYDVSSTHFLYTDSLENLN